MIRILMILFFIGICTVDIFSANNKVLVISSYGTDYQWSNNIIDGINLELKKTFPGVELNKEYLSSEFLEDSGTWGHKMGVLLNNYRKNPPLAIVLISDEAWMAYQDADVEYLKDIPLVLCGVKPHSISTHNFTHKRDSLRLSDFTPTTQAMQKYNATGVLREMNIPGYLSLMDNLISGLNRFVFITDSRFYGIYTRILLQLEAEKNYPQIPAEYIDARFVSTDSLLSRLPHIRVTAGVLLTSWLTGEYGFEYSKDYIYGLMENKLRVPIFITNDIGMEKEFFLGGYFNEGSFWGEKTADILIEILNGKKPEKIEPRIFRDERCYIAWRVLKHYQLDSSRLPAKACFYNSPEPFFVTYKYYIIGTSAVFLIFIIFYLYTLRSNFKLQNTQRLLLKSIDETRAANTKLEIAYESLTVALEKAEESDRLKSAFLANMSHEIRTPLNAIVGFSGVISEIDSKEERTEFAELIQRNSDLLLQLISDILDLSKIEAGMLNLTFESFNAREVCANVITSLQGKCKPEVKLSLREPSLPMPLHTDQNRLMQVIINLVNNAIKFTPQGSIELGYFSYNDELVEFYVKDTGIGLSQEGISSVFGRFIKLNSYIEGTGLGLSISKTIVEMLGGEIGVESVEGEGSRFWFRIKKDQQPTLPPHRGTVCI